MMILYIFAVAYVFYDDAMYSIWFVGLDCSLSYPFHIVDECNFRVLIELIFLWDVIVVP